ncbi:MAG: 16S rRNA (guanine(966)-N(2))-methyltransferase RsmD [Sulfuritalea sp.]|nr:16S rRNA (guanine(966)-N(2))-methyltransferase RsmD [Sulfuritalea sp.]MBK8759839.1 16S rRNA (guanine(966)-N(2))-methyltransferase RsmD [Sulfuritalea sp.]MBK9351025.1 16S rRNA (guanine(966)-N(2))-methyltransferase RsmD [Sulfuritalea sp.]MBP6636708.1 16S rRNA (guanine(966)-N(2))-methyltransferase RsmD [Sulfuritalea sp.]MBP7421906.1 16S rRNA (guanine(966)-N(2))-methyltransferase RsmD [Sulfuritalea sp.]
MSRIRITGGEWRSRLIQVADAPGLRPTPDRVRETLFNWLGQDLSGLSCLDLFAGSGILGFEAASRGADCVALVERAKLPFDALKKHAEGFDCPRLELFCCDALKFTPPSGRRFDVLFLDPPYGQGWLDRIVCRLDDLAAPRARLYAEAEQPLQRLGSWSVVKQGRAGQVFFHLLEQA